MKDSMFHISKVEGHSNHKLPKKSSPMLSRSAHCSEKNFTLNSHKARKFLCYFYYIKVNIIVTLYMENCFVCVRRTAPYINRISLTSLENIYTQTP